MPAVLTSPQRGSESYSCYSTSANKGLRGAQDRGEKTREHLSQNLVGVGMDCMSITKPHGGRSQRPGERAQSGAHLWEACGVGGGRLAQEGPAWGHSVTSLGN